MQGSGFAGDFSSRQVYVRERESCTGIWLGMGMFLGFCLVEGFRKFRDCALIILNARSFSGFYKIQY